MKKIIFSGYLSNDKDCFVEIALCSYDYKKDGKKQSYYYATDFEISSSFENGRMSTIESADELVTYVRCQNMCKSDVEKIIKNINKYPADAIMIFGSEDKSHLCQRLRLQAEKNEEPVEEFIDDFYD